MKTTSTVLAVTVGLLTLALLLALTWAGRGMDYSYSIQP